MMGEWQFVIQALKSFLDDLTTKMDTGFPGEDLAERGWRSALSRGFCTHFVSGKSMIRCT
jgi:hypothetical protein